MDLAITGAAGGPLELRLYDLQGRLRWRIEMAANGSGNDTVSLRFSDAPEPLHGGLYFLRVADVAGRRSGTLKLVVVP